MDNKTGQNHGQEHARTGQPQDKGRARAYGGHRDGRGRLPCAVHRGLAALRGIGQYKAEGQALGKGEENRPKGSRNPATGGDAFKKKMAEGLKIAQENGTTYELFSNSPIPDRIKQWLTKKGIPYTEILD